MYNRCGECRLIDYCGDPYQEPYLCLDNRFMDMDVEEYLRRAETSPYGDKEDIANDVYNRRKRSV